MGIFFDPHDSKRCCICGELGAETGEHKIKASALREIFGHDRMTIGEIGGTRGTKLAQGPKSKFLKFGAKICVNCNGAATQNADREFDRFHKLAARYLAANKDPAEVFSLARYAIGTDAYLNVFRFFAKQLCCQVAEAGGPRPIEAGHFAIGQSHRNIIFLGIDGDPSALEYQKVTGEHQYAAHGGLTVPADKNTHIPNGFASTLTLGAVRYIYRVDFSPAVGMAIILAHRAFWKKCQIALEEALANPLTDEERKRLGL